MADTKNIELYCSRCKHITGHKWDWVPDNEVTTQCVACKLSKYFQPSVEMSRLLMTMVAQ